MKILNYGSLNYDYTYRVPHMVQPGETLSSLELQIRCGGKGLNQSVALARAGIPVFHAGMVGEDGGTMLSLCRENGVDASFIRVCPGKSGHAIIQVDDRGENCILLYGGANQQNSPEQIEDVLSHFGQGDILLIQNEINCLGELVERASQKGMRIVMNPSPFTPSLLEMPLERVDTFLINETEGEQMSGEKTPEKILSRLLERYPNARIVLTLGSQGVLYASARERTSVPAFHVEAVDTTAAGDTFTGYFLSGLLQELPVREALTRACAASALAVTRCGAVDSIPWKQDVERFLETGFDETEAPAPGGRAEPCSLSC